MDKINLRLYQSCIKYETATFSAKQLQQKMQKFGANISIKTLRLWLQDDINVFQLEKDVYITKTGCFTGREFGIKPSKYEIDHNILIVGHRCVPFIDGDILHISSICLCTTQGIGTGIIVQRFCRQL